MRGNGNIFHPGDSSAIEIRIGEAILNRVYIQKSTPPVNLKQEGEKARSVPTSSVAPARMIHDGSRRTVNVGRASLAFVCPGQPQQLH